MSQNKLLRTCADRNKGAIDMTAVTFWSSIYVNQRKQGINMVRKVNRHIMDQHDGNNA